MHVTIGNDRYEITVVPGQKTYRYVYPNRMGTVSIQLTTKDPASEIVYGPQDAYNGISPVEVEATVTAEDDTEAVYIVTVIGSLNVAELESNAILTTLEITSLQRVLPLSPVFSSDVFTYICNVPDGVDRIFMQAVPGYEHATVTLPDAAIAIGLFVKEFRVTSADGNHQNAYNVLFVRNA